MSDSNKNYNKIVVGILKNELDQVLIVRRKEVTPTIEGGTLEWTFLSTKIRQEFLDKPLEKTLSDFILAETGYEVEITRNISHRFYHPLSNELFYYECKSIARHVEKINRKETVEEKWVYPNELVNYFSVNIDPGVRKFLNLI